MNTTTQFKKGFRKRVNIYSVLAVIAGITFGVITSSGLFIFLALGLAAITHFSNN